MEGKLLRAIHPLTKEEGKREIVDALRNQPKGTKLVPAGSKRGSKDPERDWSQASYDDLEKELVKSI
jgi:hypothetical protein